MAITVELKGSINFLCSTYRQADRSEARSSIPNVT